MCHPGKATTRAHGQQMSSGLIVRLRAGSGLLGTVEKRHRTARPGGRYKPFSREIAIWAVWAGDKNSALDGPPRAHFIGDYPVSFAFCRIPPGTSALSEYEGDPMLISPSTRFHTLRSAYCHLKGFEGVNWRETARVRRHRHATGCLTACLMATGPKLLRNGQKLIGQDRGGWRLHENYCPLRLQYALF